MKQTSINLVVAKDDESSALFLKLLLRALGFEAPASPPPQRPDPPQQALEQTTT